MGIVKEWRLENEERTATAEGQRWRVPQIITHDVKEAWAMASVDVGSGSDSE